MINAEGHVYFGDWANDKAEGKGTFKHTDGTTYEGDWKNDVQSGFGKETWNDGSVYEGMYLDSLKHGHGVFKWADGSMYEGEFFKNDISGVGKIPNPIKFPFFAFFDFSKVLISGLIRGNTSEAG